MQFIRLISLVLIVVCLAVFFTAKMKSGAPTGGLVVAENFGGSYTLTNQDGETVTDKDFRDQYRLLYFGFTYCPAICPTELQHINTVLKELGDHADRIQPMFITVDPERDTAEVMKQYVSLFHPRLVGLTGTVEQIKDVTKKYKIYAAKVKDESMHEYTMDHSSFIYFMGPNDTLLQIFKIDDPIEKIVMEVENVLKNANPQ